MNKCVFVIDQTLPIGLAANTSAILSLSLGQRNLGLIGPDLMDKGGVVHAGITTIVMPVLKGDNYIIREIFKKAKLLENSGVHVIDVTDAAQTTKNYSDYTQKLLERSVDELYFLGICLYGPSGIIKSLTGSLSLLRG